MELLDVTLREGEQRAGHSYTVDQKVQAVETLSTLGVSYVQVGFPVADDRTRKVCDRVDVEADIAGIARVIDRDVEAAIESGVDVIELFAPTSDRQREQLLGIDREELTDRVESAVARGREAGREIHFTAMDGFRSDPEFISTLFSTIVDDVAYCSIADTVGARTPAGVRSFLDSLSPGLDRSTVGVHFHDDLGVSTANALAAAEQGVGKVDVSVAGVGERAGNTPLEEFVVAGATGEEEVAPDIDVSELIPAANSVVETIEEDVPAGKPVLGSGAFEHESGLHTAAMLDDPATFEPFDPSTFGGERRLLFGDASGHGAAEGLLERAGREPTEERVDALLDALGGGEEYTLAEALDLAQSIE
jgi:isopropylmalate/homocitrate/citramalate synthase